MTLSESIAYLRNLKFRLFGKMYDLKHGVDTNEHVLEKDLELSKEQYYPYVPVDVPSFKKILDAIEFTPEDIFIDLGCGKGRSLMLAREMGFKKAVGVEFCPELVDIAIENTKDDKGIEIILADATKICLTDDINFVFLHCPFTEEFFDKFLKNLEDSLKANPRKLSFLYNFPLEHKKVVKSDYFKEIPLPIEQFQASYKLYKSI